MLGTRGNMGYQNGDPVEGVGIFWRPPPEPRVSPFLKCDYLFCSHHRSFNLCEDVGPHSHTEGPVDPFHRVWVARKIEQHLSVVELGWVLLKVSKQPEEKLSHKKNFNQRQNGYILVVRAAENPCRSAGLKLPSED